LKESLKDAERSHQTIQEQLDLMTEEHSKIRRTKDETSTQLSELEEKLRQSRLKWEEELAELKAAKAKMSDNSDANVQMLDNQLEEAGHQRDAVREDLRKAKEELTKEREELEATQKKLMGKLARATKSKEELQAIKDESDRIHAKSMPSLCKNICQHAADLNPWANILEAEREYNYKRITIPGNEINDLTLTEQLQSLSKLVKHQNVNFEKLLDDRSKEKQEVISVAMGKLKKREKTKQEREIEAETGQLVDSEEESDHEKSKKSTHTRRDAKGKQ